MAETAVAFNSVGTISGVVNQSGIISSPTNLQFGPDGRLYVTEQNGTINAFTIAVQNGQYVATAVEEIDLIKNIQNHNDDGTLFNSGEQKRLVTGLLVDGTPENPVLYVSSSDWRIGTTFDKNLDTNSGVVTRLTWNGNSWDAVDLIRGLPRSEENHATNGLALSPDGTKLYVLQGSNTNAGAPSSGFVYLSDYALSGAVLEVDLTALDAMQVKTDTTTGLNNGRSYIYDLPTLDDPNRVNGGALEDANGMDVAGPWGGNDGLNQAILPSDAPLRIYATGVRNGYDLVMTADGRLYNVDNGWNQGFGGYPSYDVNGEAVNTINNGGVNDGEPLILIEEGGYYGFANPTRSNQNQSWTVYNDNGTPDTSLAVNTVADISALVPAGVNIASGYLIDPSKFTSDPATLEREGTPILRIGPDSNALLVLGSSSNGLVEYTADNFGGALQGDLLVAQFNGTIARLNLTADASAPGGYSAIYQTIPGLSGLSTPLDVAVGPDGTLWVAEIFGDRISIFAPTDVIVPGNPDSDGDGIFNVDDPFIRDATNGGLAFILPNRTLVWDFDANIDGNRPGPGGYGGGLTGVMINGVTDFDAFFGGPADFPTQDIRLDNVKFTTAAAGGATVIENASTGSATGAANTGQYLFHVGATVATTVDAFTVHLTAINPFPDIAVAGPNQQIGTYVGAGDQSNFLKLVAVNNGAAGGQIQFGLENNDVYTSYVIDAPGLLTAPSGGEILFEVTIDRLAGTATPTVTYDIAGGSNSVTGAAIDISGSNVEKVIDGQWTVMGLPSGLAAGLYASNIGQLTQDTFQAAFTDLQISGEGSTDGTVLYRVNAGGAAVAATDGGPNWTVNSDTDVGAYMVSGVANLRKNASTNVADATLPSYVPQGVITTERYDTVPAPDLKYAFNVPEPGLYEVRLFVGASFPFLDQVNDTIFDARVEGILDSAFDNIDPVALFGFREVGMVSAVFEVRDGTLNLDFVHDAGWNPTVNGIEILHLASFNQALATLSVQPPNPVSVVESGDTGDTVLSFPVVFNRTPVSPVTVTYDVSINGQTVVSGAELNLGFDNGVINVPVANDAVNNGPETVHVQLTGITAGDNGTDLGQVSADGTVTEDDTATAIQNTLTVRAGGNGEVGDAPQFEVFADGVSLGVREITDPLVQNIGFDVSNDALFQDYVFNFEGAPPQTIEVIYFNDGTTTGGIGRDLYVDYVKLNGYQFESEMDAFYTPNNGNPAFGGPRENLLVNGTLLFDGLPDTSGGLAPSALVQVKPGQANFNTSTFIDTSFVITNTGDTNIASITFNIASALLPDVVFDPTQKAGDPGGRGVRVSPTSDDVGWVVPGNPDLDPFSVFHNGVDDNDGFEVVTLHFRDFNPGEVFLFGADADPTSIKGATAPSTVGSISGLEMIGSAVTVTFAGNTAITGNLFDDGSNGGADVVIAPGAPAAAPVLSLVGVAAPDSVTEASQVLRVEGPVGANVTILQVDARLATPEPNTPFTFYDLDPFEANMAMARATYSATIGAGGFVDVPVTLLRTVSGDGYGNGGYNHFVAAIDGAAGQTSATSGVLVVQLEEPSAGNSAPTITAGATDDTGMVTEDAASPGLTDTGTITFNDVDLADMHTASVAADPTNTVGGKLVLGAVSESPATASGTVGWTYVVPNSATQYLNAGQAVQEKFTVTIDDGNGGTVNQLITVTLNGADTVAPIVGTSGGETLNGTAGNDVISGLGGNDWIYGGDGDDAIDGGPGTDRLFGGSGGNHFVFTPGMGLDVVYDFKDGIDKIKFVGIDASAISVLAYGTTDTEIRGTGGERMVLRNIDPSQIDGDDFIGISLGGPLIGTPGADTLNGTAANDEILGLGGNDWLYGHDGADTLDGGPGTDRLYGGAGPDKFVFSPGMGLDVVYDFEDGTDLIKVTGFSGPDISILAYGTTDTEIRGPGGERMVLRNIDPSQINGADFEGITLGGPIVGTSGADTLNGTSADDNISGLGGNDWLYGHAGMDRLNGGPGTDRLYGGADADTFVFEAGMGLDVVYDFQDGLDKIEVVGLADTDLVIIPYGATDTEIQFSASDRMVLRGIDPSQIDFVDDFVFT